MNKRLTVLLAANAGALMLVAGLLCFKTKSPAPVLNAGVAHAESGAVTPGLNASSNIPSAQASAPRIEEMGTRPPEGAGNWSVAKSTEAAGGGLQNIQSGQALAHRVEGTGLEGTDTTPAAMAGDGTVTPSNQAAATTYVAPAAQIPLAFVAAEQSADGAQGQSGAGAAGQAGGDPEKDQVLGNIANDFVQAAQKDTADPSDPRYAADWEKAQMEADEQLRAQIGFDAFNALQWQSTQVSPPASR